MNVRFVPLEFTVPILRLSTKAILLPSGDHADAAPEVLLKLVGLLSSLLIILRLGLKNTIFRPSFETSGLWVIVTEEFKTTLLLPSGLITVRLELLSPK